jgi:Na+/proline symporter
VQDNALYQATCLPVILAVAVVVVVVVIYAEGAIIADIIKYADSESSANSLKNLGGNSKSQQPQPTAFLKPPPLNSQFQIAFPSELGVII